VNVCESTNKQKTLEDYLHREAILGPDPRGGAMAMLFATEMGGLR
jgi:unsaturated rhamnogalacturonyl hydrolase